MNADSSLKSVESRRARTVGGWWHSRILAFIGWIICATCLNAADPEPAAGPTEFIVGLSPYLEPSVKDDLYRRLVGFLLEEMPLESTLTLYDAHRLRTIAELEIPKTRAFQSSRTRANQFREPIRKLRDFLAVTNEPPPASVPGAVRLPQFLDSIAERSVPSNHAIVVLILGSPFYADSKEPGFSMLDGYFPTDGHLQASRDETVYGLRERRGSLNGMVVHLGYFGDPWVSDVHQDKIARFWSLYLRGQGARLGAFTGDLAALFKSARVNPASLRAVGGEINSADTKIAMVRVSRNVGMADWITRDTLPDQPVAPPIRTAGPLKVGIRWRGSVDLDLYARPVPGAQTLFFQHPRSPEGYYFKDHRSSPDREYEFIEFEEPVNLWELEVRVNFFEGESQEGIAGEVRIEFEGRIYTGTFQIEASHGNQGRTGPTQRACWTRIDIPQLLKLRTASARRP